MHTPSLRVQSRDSAIHRESRIAELPLDKNGKQLNPSEYYGENAFDIFKSKNIPDDIKVKAKEYVTSNKNNLDQKDIKIIAEAVLKWAQKREATHFCHWFQPLTGDTAEKHDAFLSLKNGKPIEKLSASQLMQGEPDASSFPHGGSRSTFEARGYTSWDISSPLFILEGINGKTLCIPTAFVSYTSEALDIKTPLLRSITRLNQVATEFLQITGSKDSKNISVCCGPEQEYFLVDKSFFYNRLDLIMTGRTLFGSLTARNQQLEDHYFGTIPDRILSFMQELEMELYRVGIPAKTRHNEVAPGQFEMAPIFEEGNVAADHNQLTMALMRKVAKRHDFEVLLHEKPFSGINGSGKHMNWSIMDNLGQNLFEPGTNPHENKRFLCMIAITCEAVKRHAGMLRMAIASHGNDHRLGANEAPPSIISIFLGDTLDKIVRSILKGEKFNPDQNTGIDLGATQLSQLFKDNTDRNRTSPFAFTGNKFEVRAVGSSQTIGFPQSILNAAVAEVLSDTNKELKKLIDGGQNIDDALSKITKQWLESSQHVIFNGDGYSEEWVKEAEKRGLPNLRTTANSLSWMKDEKNTAFLVEQEIYKPSELAMRYNVSLERYIKHREIEYLTLESLVHQHVLPAAINYKERLARLIKEQKEIALESKHEKNILKKLNELTDNLVQNLDELNSGLSECLELEEQKAAEKIADVLQPKSEQIAEICNQLEEMSPDNFWTLPKYFEMLFVR